MTTRHEEYTGLLGDYLDERLAGPERAGVAEHLDRCGECRAALQAMAALRRAARELPRGVAPSRDLWPGIAARIAAGERVSPASERPRRLAGRSAGRWVPLAAAALLLVVLSSAVGVALLRTGPADAVRPGVSGADVQDPGDATTALAAFRPGEIDYEDAVASLQSELEARRDDLAPETVATIESNLLIIDRAIAEARAALEADPSSTDLPLHLSDIYRRKVELLRSAVQLRT